MTGIEFLIVVAITLAISAAAAGLSYALTPKPSVEEPQPSGLGDFGFPTNLESRYIPVVWGTTRIDGQNVIWYGDWSARGLTTGGNIVGYEYSLGMDLALCWGPIDNISEITIDDDFAMSPGQSYALRDAITGGLAFVPITGYSAPVSGERLLYFNDGQFFGGSKLGGRLIGNLRFYYGTENQTPNAYIAGQEAGNTLEISPGVTVDKSELVPRYAGLCHAVWEGGILSDHAVLKQWKFTVHRYPTSLSSQYSKVSEDPTSGFADANPAHVLYEILTDTNWGLSIPIELIDVPSFLAVAEVCYQEGNGFSYTMDSAKKASSVIEDINAQINAMLVQNAQGRFELRLLRRTYRTSDNAELDYSGTATGNFISTINESSIIKLKAASRQSWDETFNVVQVKYNDRYSEFKEAVATAHDLGNMAIQNGRRRVKKINTVGVRTSNAAAVVAQRNLVSHSYPITTVDLEVSREFSDLRPGDVIEIDHPDFGLQDFYMRILEVGLPKDTDGNVTLKGIRDVFDEPASSEVMHVGGDTTVSALESTKAVAATTIDVTGLPHFLHKYLGLGTDYHTWHIVGAPNSTSRAGRPFIQDPLAPGVFEPTGDTKTLSPVGRVIAHSSDLWVDRNFARRYDRYNLGTSANAIGPYADGPGPMTNPIMHDNNTSVTDQRAWMDQGYTKGLMQVYKPSQSPLPGGPFGSIWVADLPDPEGMVQSISDEQIQYHGYGLAVVKPAWANGDSRFDEIIAYRKASVINVQAIRFLFDATAFDVYVGEDWFADNNVPENQRDRYRVAESHKILMLDEVYRGVLDSGIQTINTDSEIIFINAADVMYDEVGSLASELQTGGAWVAAGDRTYRHQTIAVGSGLDLDTVSDKTVTAEERYRRSFPAPPVKLRWVPQPGTTEDTPNEFWGRAYYDNNQWQAYYFPNHGVNSAVASLRFNHQDVTAESNPRVWFYSESSANVAGEGSRITWNLLEDDSSSSTQAQREYHARARMKEGWMPTTPPVSYGEPGAVENPFKASAEQDVNAQGNSASHNANLQTLFAGAPYNCSFTAGQRYYVEVWVQMRNHTAAPHELSRGAQRSMFVFTAQ